MSTEKTSFSTLPNEIVYCIFEFLNNFDILKPFVKQIDLTGNWDVSQSVLKHICETTEKVKVNRYGLDLFTNYRFPQLHSLILVDIVE